MKQIIGFVLIMSCTAGCIWGVRRVYDAYQGGKLMDYISNMSSMENLNIPIPVKTRNDLNALSAAAQKVKKDKTDRDMCIGELVAAVSGLGIGAGIILLIPGLLDKIKTSFSPKYSRPSFG